MTVTASVPVTVSGNRGRLRFSGPSACGTTSVLARIVPSNYTWNVTQNFTPDAKGLSRPAAIVHFGLLCLAGGYAAMVAVHDPPLASMVRGTLLGPARRAELLSSLVFWSLATAGILVIVAVAARRSGRWPADLDQLVTGVWPLSLLPLAWYVFSPGVWQAAPLILFALTAAACGYCVVRTRLPELKWRFTLPRALLAWSPALVVGVAIAAYVVYVSIHTICHHWSLGTSAFDLGIQENTLWNTIHGDVLHSSLMHGHYLGVHTSFVLLLIAPVYALAPSTETLLVLQALAVGLTAWPLFVLARETLGSRLQGAIVALIWLSHPAVGGANFYDFHPVALAPLLVCSAAAFWRLERWPYFWISIALLLSVKEEMAIVVVLLGAAMVLGGQRRRGVTLVAIGVIAYFALQHLVIPHFAGEAHSYSWYYTEMIPGDEGPGGLVVTALLNPVHTLDVALNSAKALYVLQLFAPLAFLPFVTARGWLLVSYGLAATLLATRPPLHQIGFQYALTLLALGFLGALLALARLGPGAHRRALALAVMLAVVTCFHYGMIWPRHQFRGGFTVVDFDYSEADRTRYRELRDLVARIPGGASVLASERLVPHVARRHTVETTRHLGAGRASDFDAVLLFADRSVPPGLDVYELHATRHFTLYTRREPAQ